MPNFKIVGEREYSTTTANEDNNFYTSSVASCLVIYGEKPNGEAKFAHLLSANYVNNTGEIKNAPLSYLQDYTINRHVYCNSDYIEQFSTKKLLDFFTNDTNGYTKISKASRDCVFYEGAYTEQKLQNVPSNIPAYNSADSIMKQSNQPDRNFDFA